MFEFIDAIFKQVYDINDYSRAIVALITVFGALVILILSIWVTFRLIQVFRLYFIHQYCCQKDLIKKYGKWAVISGSTDGIGQAMAKLLAERGMSIIVIGRNEAKLANTKAMLEQVPNAGEIITVKIDLSDSSTENFNRIRQQIDPENRDIGILINNAGSFPSNFLRFNRYDIDFLVNLVNLNVTATVHLTRMIMPGMVQRGKGLVMNVSSSLGSFPGPYLSVYSPTKAFVDSFTRQLQMEYSSHPLDIVLLKPGPVHTKLMIDSAKVKSSIAVPTADEYAKSALNALSAGVSIYSGTMLHGIAVEFGKLGDILGVMSWVFKLNMRLNALNYELSPVPKRKHLGSVSGAASNQYNRDGLETISLSGGASATTQAKQS